MELFDCEKRGVRRWYHLPAEAADLRRALAMLAVNRPAERHQLTAIGLAPELSEAAAAQWTVHESADAGDDLLGQALQQAPRWASGRPRPRKPRKWGRGWIELRRDQLAPNQPEAGVSRARRMAAAAAILALGCMIGTLVFGEYQFQQVADRHERLQRRLFSETFPDQSVPRGVRSRMASELARLRGVSGQSVEVPERAEALALLAHATAALPKELRFRLTDIRIEDRRLRLEGQVRAHGDADQLATALRETGRFKVPAPRTDSLPDRGVAFTLTVRAIEPASERGSSPVRQAAKGADP
jgi:hypothetical protein